MKKLTRTSLSALKNARTMLTEQQQRAIRGGCSLDDMGIGYWIGDNYYWNRTSECTCGGSYNYGSGGNGSTDYYYGYMGPDNPISQDEFYRLLEEGCWYGGYVEELGYVSSEFTVYGYYNNGDTPTWDCVFQCMAYLDPSRTVDEYISNFRDQYYDPQEIGGIYTIDHEKAFGSGGFNAQETDRLRRGSNDQLVVVNTGNGQTHMVVFTGEFVSSEVIKVKDPSRNNEEYEIHIGHIREIYNVYKY